MLKTKIVCTLGPACEQKETLAGLIRAGMNIARLNFSHGTHDEHRTRILKLREVAEEMNANVAVMLDTRGPEIRIGNFRSGKVMLKEDQEFSLYTTPVDGDETKVYITYSGITKIVNPGDKILLDDGLIELKVKQVSDDNVRCIVINGGEISNHKGVNIPNKSLPLPPLTEKDIDDLLFGIKMEVDFVAASFIRKATDVLEIRKILEENGGADIHIIAKVESREGIDNIDEIIQVADGIMVARGDLGVEIPVEEVPLVQKAIIEKCNRVGKPVVIATQMLDSMMRNPRPTRAEATDVANAIFDGADAIMLSGETAAGLFPEQAVATMVKIAQRAEQAIEFTREKATYSTTTVTDAISHATYAIARDLKVKAIITSTKSGYTARAVSKYRPDVQIIAVTSNEKVYKTLLIVRGVIPVKIEPTRSTDEMFSKAVESARKSGYVQNGDLVIITAGVPVNASGTTNLIRVLVVGDVTLRGIGVGNKAVNGTAYVVKSFNEIIAMPDGAILVVHSTDKNYLPYLKRASAIITETGGLTSHAAIVGIEMKIPVIVGATGACDIISTGDEITMDVHRGLIYRGKVDVR